MDIIYQELKNLLNVRLMEVGETEAKIAKEVGCSQGHVNRLKNVDGSFEALKLSTFLALFPQLGKMLASEIHRMAINAGVGVSASSSKNNGDELAHVIQNSPGASMNINNGNNNVNNNAAPPSSEVIKSAMYDLLARIMASDEIDASAKVILYNAINDFLNNAQK